MSVRISAHEWNATLSEWVPPGAVDDYIKKFGECPLTGKKCTKKDVIMLKEGGTGFAAHGSESVEVTKWANAGHYG